MPAQRRKSKYRKLVRDRIPEIIQRNGEEPLTRILTVTEFKEALFDKLIEEVGEMKAAKTHRTLLQERADVAEVLKAIDKLNRLSAKRINKVRKRKRATHGAFKKRIYLEGVKKKKK